MTEFEKEVSYGILVYVSFIKHGLVVGLLLSKLHFTYLTIMVGETVCGGTNVKLIDI
jgi:predicted branched-subunit amino acid permease